MLNPHDRDELALWHYVSGNPLSATQLIASGSVDAETIGLIWLLLECGASLTVAGPADPQPGAGKTTTINALLQFLPPGTTVHYMKGMYEDFAFTRQPVARPGSTCIFSNEVSDHLAIYMWGDVAQRYLRLPEKGYRIATTVHADTVEDVIWMYRRDLSLDAKEVRRLGLIVNIGFAERSFASKRRWSTLHFIRPTVEDDNPLKVTPIPLMRWHRSSDSFEHADAFARARLAQWCGLSAHVFEAALTRRVACLRNLASLGQATPSAMTSAIVQLRHLEQQL